MSKRRIWTLFERWYKCTKHNIPFPNGSKCPKCKSEIGKSHPRAGDGNGLENRRL